MLAKQYSETITAFAIQAWVSLDWPVPDVIVPMPGAKSFAMGFSEIIGSPIAHLFTRDLRCDVDAIHVDQIILILNVESSLEECSQAIRQLVGASPLRGYLLSVNHTNEATASNYSRLNHY